MTRGTLDGRFGAGRTCGQAGVGRTGRRVNQMAWPARTVLQFGLTTTMMTTTTTGMTSPAGSRSPSSARQGTVMGWGEITSWITAVVTMLVAARCGEVTAGKTQNVQEVSKCCHVKNVGRFFLSQIWFVDIETVGQSFPTHTQIQIAAFLIVKVLN